MSKIYALAEQAAEHAVLNYSGEALQSERDDVLIQIPKEFIDCFAELIMQECVQVALNELVPDDEIDNTDDIEDRCYLRGNNGGIVDAVVSIKQHFGVENA